MFTSRFTFHLDGESEAALEVAPSAGVVALTVTDGQLAYGPTGHGQVTFYGTPEKVASVAWRMLAAVEPHLDDDAWSRIVDGAFEVQP